jgi:hypothetical protein
MTYQIFYLSKGNIYPLSELDPENSDHEFASLEEAQSCFRGWIDAGIVNYPKVTFVVLPVIK